LNNFRAGTPKNKNAGLQIRFLNIGRPAGIYRLCAQISEQNAHHLFGNSRFFPYPLSNFGDSTSAGSALLRGHDFLSC
jgi:hypothetical protein